MRIFRKKRMIPSAIIEQSLDNKLDYPGGQNCELEKLKKLYLVGRSMPYSNI